MELERRYQRDLRELVDGYLSTGWLVAARNPLVIVRGRSAKYVDFGCLKNGRPV